MFLVYMCLFTLLILCLIVAVSIVWVMRSQRLEDEREEIGLNVYWFACKKCGQRIAGRGYEYFGKKSVCCGSDYLIWSCPNCRKAPTLNKHYNAGIKVTLPPVGHCEFCGREFSWSEISQKISPCHLIDRLMIKGNEEISA